MNREINRMCEQNRRERERGKSQWRRKRRRRRKGRGVLGACDLGVSMKASERATIG